HAGLDQAERPAGCPLDDAEAAAGKTGVDAEDAEAGARGLPAGQCHRNPRVIETPVMETPVMETQSSKPPASKALSSNPCDSPAEHLFGSVKLTVRRVRPSCTPGGVSPECFLYEQSPGRT